MAQVEAWAGWSQEGGSDKVWAAAVCGHEYRSVSGKRGSGLLPANKTLDTPAAAQKLYNSKVSEKAGKGYKPVPFNDSATGIPFLFDEQRSAQAGAATVTVTVAPRRRETEYVVGHVTPLDQAALDAVYNDPRYGLSEKVNGARCVVASVACAQASDGRTLSAYNRKGQRETTLPAGAGAFSALGFPLVVDGERLFDQSYIVFDVLEWDGQDCRSWPYSARIAVLTRAHALGHLSATIGSDTEEARANCLHILTAATQDKSGLAARILARGGEGVVVRDLSAPYVAGDTRHIRKFKYLADLDAFVIRVNPGLATGSVTLGLVRPSDGAIIEICNVRSGLRDSDVIALGAELARGERPVLRVGYLPARSVTWKIVEPRTSINDRRRDKTWSECTTTQLGADKAAIVAGAPAMKGAMAAR